MNDVQVYALLLGGRHSRWGVGWEVRRLHVSLVHWRGYDLRRQMEAKWEAED
jgi:hypothetical protein